MTAYYRVNQRLAAQIVDMMEKPWYSPRREMIRSVTTAAENGRAIATTPPDRVDFLNRQALTAGRHDDGQPTRSRKSWASSTSRPTASPTAAMPSTPGASRTCPTLARHGADLLDLGGRIDPARVGSGLARRRALPRAARALEQCADASWRSPLSIDTSKARVAELAWPRRRASSTTSPALRGRPRDGSGGRRGGCRRRAHAHAGHTRQPCRSTRSIDDVVAEVLSFLAESHRLVRGREASRGRGSPSIRASASARRIAA